MNGKIFLLYNSTRQGRGAVNMPDNIEFKI